MISYNGVYVDHGHFPDKSLHIKLFPDEKETAMISWRYEDDSELFLLICLTKHLRDKGVRRIVLDMPYIPHARMDRVKDQGDVFTLKYFAEIINSLNFSAVYVVDPHSSVSNALINNLHLEDASYIVKRCIGLCSPSLLFYPDEGAMKRYSDKANRPYAFGIKRRDWQTGKILGLDVAGETSLIAGKDILIVDDICSRGGTFYHSAKKLKEMGANKVYLFVTHCENTILQGDLLDSGLIERVYTTNSIFTQKHPKIEVFEL